MGTVIAAGAVGWLSGSPKLDWQWPAHSWLVEPGITPGVRLTVTGKSLFGDYPPTGTLSFSWPRSVDQHPINVGDEDYDPLFAFGYGSSW